MFKPNPTAKPIAILPMEDYNLIIRPSEGGYTIYTSNQHGEVASLHLACETRKFAGEKITKLNAGIVLSYEQPWYYQNRELLTPDNAPKVIQLDDGRLWCKKCHCFIPNTANSEMRKEGCYSHSHICGVKKDDEIYLSEAETARQLLPVF